MLRTRRAEPDLALGLALCALVLFAVANAYPLATLAANGTMRPATLAGASLALYHNGYPTIALLVAFTTILVPLAQILGFIGVLGTLLHARRRRRRAPAALLAHIRLLGPLRPWTMIEVFLLGALVALSKLSSMAQVIPGGALLAYGLLMLTLAALWSATPGEQLWHWIERPPA